MFVLIVAHHHIHAVNLHLTLFALWIFRINTNLHARDCFTARTICVLLPIFVTNEWSALGHTITHTIHKVHILHTGLHFLVERSTTDNEVTQVAAKCLQQSATNLLVQEFLDTRSFPQHFHQWFIDHRQHFTFDNLLNHQRYSQNHKWMYLCKCLHQCAWSRSLSQEIKFCTVTHLIEELKCQTKHMRNRQHRHHLIAWLVWNFLTCKINITTQVFVGQHYTLRVTCRTRCIVNQRQIVMIISRINDVLCTKTIRPLLLKFLIDSRINLLYLLTCCILQ